MAKPTPLSPEAQARRDRMDAITAKCNAINDAFEGGHIGDFYFNIADTFAREDGFAVIRILDHDNFYHAVPPALFTVETLMLCNMIDVRAFGNGKRCGEYLARQKIREALGIVGHEEEKRFGA